MNTLNKIIQHKKEEVHLRKELYPIKLLERSPYFSSPTLSLSHYIKKEDKTGIIAEFKRNSPSKGVINAHAPVERTTIGYMQAGASALSVLTDTQFFNGTNEDLKEARTFNFCPILRKDFTIEEYQILEAKSIGADAILLIAAILTPQQIESFCKLAHSLELEVLLEVHNKQELLNNLNCPVDLIGVNNRDLRTFETNINRSLELFPLIPSSITAISESGIANPETIMHLKEAGYQGFLIGETFMKHNHPELEALQFMNTLKKLNKAFTV